MVDKITELCECYIHIVKDSFASGVLEQKAMHHLCVVVMFAGASSGDGQHDEPSQLDTSLKEIKTFDIYKALEAYPVGRKLYGKAQANFAELKQVASALDKCRETINKVDLKPSDLETAIGMAQHPEAHAREVALLRAEANLRQVSARRDALWSVLEPKLKQAVPVSSEE